MNKRIFNTSLTVGCLLLLATGNAGAWTIQQSYDNENVGAKCNKWGSSQSIVSSDESASGANRVSKVLMKVKLDLASGVES